MVRGGRGRAIVSLRSVAVLLGITFFAFTALVNMVTPYFSGTRIGDGPVAFKGFFAFFINMPSAASILGFLLGPAWSEHGMSKNRRKPPAAALDSGTRE